MTKEEKKQILKKVFTPTSPIKQVDFFRGRISQLKQIVSAINQEGQHAILYGERGVGKTSLANIMTTSITNLYPVKVTCNRQDDFKSIWERLLQGICLSQTTQGIGFQPQETTKISSLACLLSSIDDPKPSDIENIIKTLPNFLYLFVFDEFDNITSRKTRYAFADLIKSFSDNITTATIVIVGIADNVDDLIGSHQSLERCLKQVKMPLMTRDESSEIINKGLEQLEINIEPSVRDKIIEFSSGFAHYVHLLCLYGAEEIIENEKLLFNAAYLSIAINKGIENANEQLRSSYQKAITGSQANSKWVSVLNACAHAKADQFSCFKISNVLEQYNKNRPKPVKGGNIIYNINQLCTKDRGDILKKIGKGVNTRFRFQNPLMRAFVKLKMNCNTSN
jgi:Cdc6-like AAA superfamily ATPase